MDRTFHYKIDEKAEGLTVEQFLRGLGYTRHILARTKRQEDGILRNGVRTYTNALLSSGDILEIHLKEEAPSEKIVPQKLPFPVVYEDDDLLIINKPADMPVHPSIGNHGNTLSNAAAFYFQEKGEAFVFRCINRLDRDTTGLLILAKHALSGAILSKELASHGIHRTYLAVVRHAPEPLEGKITFPIGRKKGSVIERQIDPVNGENAITHYKTLRRGSAYSLVQLTLETGRTHQIRVHMKAIGCPLPGDFLYNPDFTDIKRQALHSFSLDFIHPITKEPLHFEAPLPEDMRRLLEH